MNILLPSGDPADWKLDNITELIQNITTLLLALAGFIAVIMLLVGAVNYLTAFGNEEKATAGKKTIMWAIIGIVVIALAELIVFTVWNFITPTPF